MHILTGRRCKQTLIQGEMERGDGEGRQHGDSIERGRGMGVNMYRAIATHATHAHAHAHAHAQHTHARTRQWFGLLILCKLTL